MDSTWYLMQVSSAVQYMYTYKSRYSGHHVYTVSTGNSEITRSYPPLPYPEAGVINPKFYKYYTEEQLLGLILAVGRPPETSAKAGLLGAVYGMAEWRQDMKRFMPVSATPCDGRNPFFPFLDGLTFTNAIKEYYNFEFLRQLEKSHD